MFERLVVDRAPDAAAIAVVITAVAFAVALVTEPSLDGASRLDPLEAVVAAVLGPVLAVVGFAATSRSRPPIAASAAMHARRAALSVLVGLCVGAFILGQLVLLASYDAEILSSLRRQAAAPAVDIWTRAFSPAVVEEVAMRLAGMGVLAWLVLRRGATSEKAFRIALVATAVVFGYGHMHALSWTGFVRGTAGVLAGLAYGWVFWRWGLPFAIAAHFVAGVMRGVVLEAYETALFG